MPVYLTHADVAKTQGKWKEATFNTIFREAAVFPPFSARGRMQSSRLKLGGDEKYCVPDVYAQLEDKFWHRLGLE
jgi:hypothetical protein